ncbi:MAG: SUMF1/EgtB/PvdO family nonheme iron enzyme [Gemmataceae bacterium]
MSDFESLLDAIPKDPNVAFILADYLEERGDPRCELLRLSYTLRDLEGNGSLVRRQLVDDGPGEANQPKTIFEITPERIAMEERLRELVLVEGLEPVIPQYTNEIGMEFVWIPPGKFLMGSPDDEPERYDNETQHEVTLTKGFWLQTTTVTQQQWEQVMGNNSSRFRGENLPVEHVSWNDCADFCQKVTELTGRKTVLPTQAQWEYACRAGTTSPFWFGKTITTNQANYHGEYPYAGGEKGEFRDRTVVVKSFLPNGWGLYQMHGNVREWCHNWYDTKPTVDPEVDPKGPTKSGRRVLRGGSWANAATTCRSAVRHYRAPIKRDEHIGFRCAQVSE